MGCSSLTSVTIGSGVKKIGERAFAYCAKLASIVIPASVTSMDAAVFLGCSALTSVVIGNAAVGTVGSVGYNMFQGCSSLTSVTVPNAFAGAIDTNSSLYNDGSLPSAVSYNTPLAAIPFSACPYNYDTLPVTYTAAGSVTPACLASNVNFTFAPTVIPTYKPTSSPTVTPTANPTATINRLVVFSCSSRKREGSSV